MSKIKKVLAMLLALAMVLGMSVTAFADGGTMPSDKDHGKITVKNVETGADVKAYKIVKADYNSSGLIGYSKVDENDMFDIYAPSSDDIVELAVKYRALGNGKVMTEQSNGEYTLDTEAGMYLIIVTSTGSKIYNPMIVSLGYSTEGSGSENSLVEGTISANEKWTFGDKDLYAKSSEVTIEKKADKDTANLGEIVNYEVNTVIPDYSDEYKTVKFDITDKMTALTLDFDSIKVNVDGVDVQASANTFSLNKLVAPDEGYIISFAFDYIKENGAKKVVVTYSATLTDEAVVNENPHDNEVTLNYTNNPGVDDGEKKDEQKVYTFDIDGNITGEVIKKIGKESAPLKDAEFTLYNDIECKNQYVNTKYVAGTYTTKSDKDGKLLIVGLDEGTYYLKETKAPTEYTLNDTVYEIKIAATIEEEILKSWNITVTPIVEGKPGEPIENGFTVTNSGEAQVTSGETTNILNTTISSLPSTGGIGTTIFTIGGCLIMIVAAGLFFASRRKSAK